MSNYEIFNKILFLVLLRTRILRFAETEGRSVVTMAWEGARMGNYLRVMVALLPMHETWV